ncbi:MAG TPA: LemA family protein [Candidatus Thermoplasmatota archaeon]|nr:LemA family protein [Candidatus Thermoplasmatota archaeon]
MDALGWILIAALVAVALLVLWVIVAYNRVIRLENAIDNSWAQIDVQLKRRADLIPNLVNTVKGYAAHEKGVLEGVTQARAALMGARTPTEANEADNLLTQALGKLFAVAEAYPDLKANQNFLQLQDELTHTENKVGYARQRYNDVVLDFNNAVETFPGSLIAGMMGRRERPMLAVPEADREVPRVAF